MEFATKVRCFFTTIAKKCLSPQESLVILRSIAKRVWGLLAEDGGKDARSYSIQRHPLQRAYLHAGVACPTQAALRKSHLRRSFDLPTLRPIEILPGIRFSLESRTHPAILQTHPMREVQWQAVVLLASERRMPVLH